MKKRIRFGPFSISLVFIFLVLFIYLFPMLEFMEIMELKTIDMRFRSRGEIPHRDDIVLVVIDEKSLAREGKWIWPRSKQADLISKISDGGAKVIGMDIGFLETDDATAMISRTIDGIRAEMDGLGFADDNFHKYLENIKIKSDNDKLLADVIRNVEARVVLGYFFHMDYTGMEHASTEDIARHKANISGSKYKFVRYLDESRREIPCPEARMPQSNIKVISDATGYSGYFNMFPDPDGVVRWIPAVIQFDDTPYAPLSLVTASAYLDAQASARVAPFGVESLQLGDLTIPADETGRIFINYRGPEKTFPHISATDVLQDRLPENALKDKIVMVGATAIGIYDMRVTPFSSVFPGLEIHANVLDNILSQDFMHQPNWIVYFNMLAIIVFGAFLGFTLPRSGVAAGALAGFSVFFGYIFLCRYLFVRYGLILNLVYPLTVTVCVYVSITAYRYLTESQQRKFIRAAFSTYLSPSVVKTIIDAPERLVLGGEERKITAFFSDVQGFTSISETLTPAQVVELLNEFLTEMTNIILKHEGTVDKFEGDAIVAIFGAPNDLRNQAESACRACIEMQRKLADLRLKWAAENRPRLKMRVGVNTGLALVGNMGSDKRFDYTMMGDQVNTAARLEVVNKIYGTYTLISAATFQETDGLFFAREVDLVRPVGKKQPISLYELIGYKGETDEKTAETVENYTKGLYAYKNRNWEGATAHFQAALARTPEDGPSAVMLKRCGEYMSNPPPPEWDGAFDMKFK